MRRCAGLPIFPSANGRYEPRCDACWPNFFTAHELSKRIGISEKDVAGHLEHLARSLRGRGGRLEVEPARCIECGFRFNERTRFTTPSRCPRCKDEAVAPPRFHATEENAHGT